MPLAAGDAAVLIELGAILGALGLLARLAGRFGLSAIPVYLGVGLVLGQITGGPISFSQDVVETGANVGLVLLLFMLGLEYSHEDLMSSLRSGAPAGLVDVALNFPPGMLAGMLLGWPLEAAVLLGGITYISSSGIVAKLVSDLGRLPNRETPSILTILVLEDLAMALYLPVVAVVLANRPVAVGAGLVLLAAVAGVLAIIGAARYGKSVSAALSTPSSEVLLLTVLGFVLVGAGAAEAAQLSAAVGAFLAGIALSDPVATRAGALIAPLRDLFAAAFFILFALEIDAAQIPSVAVAAGALALLTGVTKVITGARAARGAGIGTAGRLRAGTALIPRGEFSIILAGLGVSAGIESQLGPLAAAYVLFTALAGSLVTRWSDDIARLVPRLR